MLYALPYGGRRRSGRQRYHRAEYLYRHHRSHFAGRRYPEFVDIDEQTYNMDPEQLREYLETKCDRDPAYRKACFAPNRPCTITAIVPVHLYGQMADMDPILQLA